MALRSDSGIIQPLSTNERSPCNGPWPLDGTNGATSRSRHHPPWLHLYHSRMPRYLRHRLEKENYTSSDAVWHVTLCTAFRKPFLTDPRTAQLVIDTFTFSCNKANVPLFLIVVMPDHVHALVGEARKASSRPSVTSNPGHPASSRPAQAAGDFGSRPITIVVSESRNGAK